MHGRGDGRDPVEGRRGGRHRAGRPLWNEAQRKGNGVSEGQYDPHGWMFGTTPPAEPAPPKPEGIRAWYDRTTKKARKAVFWSTIVSVAVMAVMWAMASFQTLARLQTFNGALTIPLIGGIWIFSFIFMFLVPSREASFRGQEAVEEAVDLVRAGFQEQIGPMVQVWRRIGERVEIEIPRMIEESRSTLEETRSAAKCLEEAAKKNEGFSEQARPAIEALKGVSERMENEIRTGILDEIRSAAQAVKDLSGVPKDATQPDFNSALATVRKARQKAMEGRQA
jgi:hypothetical protein